METLKKIIKFTIGLAFELAVIAALICGVLYCLNTYKDGKIEDQDTELTTEDVMPSEEDDKDVVASTKPSTKKLTKKKLQKKDSETSTEPSVEETEPTIDPRVEYGLENGIHQVDEAIIPVFSGTVPQMQKFTIPYEGDAPDEGALPVVLEMHFGTKDKVMEPNAINGFDDNGYPYQVTEENKLAVWFGAANAYGPLYQGYNLDTYGLTDEECIGAMLARFDRPIGYSAGGPFNEWGVGLDGTYNTDFDTHYNDTASGLSKADYDQWVTWCSK